MSRQSEGGRKPATSTKPKASTPKSVAWIVTGGKKYRITQRWNNPSSRYVHGRHTGMDIGVPMGTKLYSATGGKVLQAGFNKAWGNYVLIKGSDGNTYRYGHLSSLGTRAGATVTAGTFLGKSGSTGNSTGPHLHFEVRTSRGADVDPTRWLTGSGTIQPAGATYAAGSSVSGNRNTTTYNYVTPGGSAGVAATKPKMTYADYGYVSSFLNAHTDVKKVVDQAIKGGWTPDRLQGAIKGTTWWKTRSETQRRNDILKAENPAEYNKQYRAAIDATNRLTTQMGLKIAAPTRLALARQFQDAGASPEEMAVRLSAYFTIPKTGAAVGTSGQALAGIQKDMAAYGVGMSAATQQAYVRQIISGQQTNEGIEDIFREQAKALYPGIKAQLDAGMTTRQYLDPFLQIAEKELGKPSSQMNLTDTKWTAPLGTTAKPTPMSADEWTVKLRTDARYGWDKTASARGMASELIGSLSKMFGVAG